MTFQTYHKIDSIQKRHTEGPLKGRFTGEWSKPEFSYLADAEWIWREKIDGTNIRIHVYSDSASGWPTVEFGGRTDNAQIPATLVAVLNEKFNTDEAKDLIVNQFDADVLREGLVLFGEGFGAGIQKGGAYGDVNFILFDVLVGKWWMLEEATTEIAQGLQIDRVPLYGTGTLNEAIKLVSSHELTSTWPEVEPEGIVAVPRFPLFDRAGRRIITKVKTVDFP